MRSVIGQRRHNAASMSLMALSRMDCVLTHFGRGFRAREAIVAAINGAVK